MIGLGSIQLAVAAIITIALIVERGIELVRPLLNKITSADWQKVVKIACAILLGFDVAALLHTDILELLGFGIFPPVAGYAVAGILASAGASPWHAILEWLKTIKS